MELKGLGKFSTTFAKYFAMIFATASYIGYALITKTLMDFEQVKGLITIGLFIVGIFGVIDISMLIGNITGKRE